MKERLSTKQAKTSRHGMARQKRYFLWTPDVLYREHKKQKLKGLMVRSTTAYPKLVEGPECWKNGLYTVKLINMLAGSCGEINVY
jgi:hypothetical protein